MCKKCKDPCYTLNELESRKNKGAKKEMDEMCNFLSAWKKWSNVRFLSFPFCDFSRYAPTPLWFLGVGSKMREKRDKSREFSCSNLQYEGMYFLGKPLQWYLLHTFGWLWWVSVKQQGREKKTLWSFCLQDYTEWSILLGLFRDRDVYKTLCICSHSTRLYAQFTISKLFTFGLGRNGRINKVRCFSQIVRV